MLVAYIRIHNRFSFVRGLASKGIYPAVDPLDSTSTMLQPRIVGNEHYETAQRVKETLQRYKELQARILSFLPFRNYENEKQFQAQSISIITGSRPRKNRHRNSRSNV